MERFNGNRDVSIEYLDVVADRVHLLLKRLLWR